MSAVCHPPADILLDPSDWYIANWRNLPPLPRPAPVPFDLAKCCARLARVKVDRSEWDWSGAEIGPCLDPDEGRFWLAAFDRAFGSEMTPDRIGKKLTELWPLPPLSRDKCIPRLHKAPGLTPEFVPALASQLDLPTLIGVLLDFFKKALYTGNSVNPFALPEILIDGFRRFVRPWLTEQELESARQVLRDDQRRTNVPSSELPDFVVCLMAALGMSHEVESALSGWAPVYDPRVLPHWHFVVFGLADPARVIPTLEQLRLRLCSPAHVRAVLAHLEGESLPFLQNAILDCVNRAEAELLTTALGLVHRPETARVMLALTRRSRGPAPAQRWLDEHRELAISGLLDVIDDGNLGDAALNYLRNQVRAGHQALIDQHLKSFASSTASRVRRALETTAAMQAVDDVAVPDWFPPIEGKKPRLPAWLDAATLSPLRIEGKRLPGPQVTTLLALLRIRTLEHPPHPLFAQLKKHAEPRLLDAFVWSVFERWHGGSGDAKDKWALTALGHLGGDGVCLPLAALVAAWPGKSQHMRANLGLECLEAIGTRLALLCIHRLAQTSHYAVGEAAGGLIRRLARQRGLTLEQFEDHIVPDLGLDGNGRRRLDYCGREYQLTLGPDRQARLLDKKRHYLSELPELQESDDPAWVEEARAEWALFKLQTREVMQIQTARLQNAMLRWRRWKLADFEQFLVRHPLLNSLTRALLWGAFETVSKLRLAFRVTEGRICVDAAGAPVALDPNWPIGVVHPVLLQADERMIWSDVLSEQGLSLPEWQMPRVTYPLEESEKKQQELSRWQGHFLDRDTTYDDSRRLGYHRGAEQRNHICCRVQYFPALDLTVYLLHTPIPLDASYETQQQAIEWTGCQFREGDTRTNVPNVNKALPLGEVDPVLMDEVIAGMNELTRTV